MRRPLGGSFDLLRCSGLGALPWRGHLGGLRAGEGRLKGREGEAAAAATATAALVPTAAAAATLPGPAAAPLRPGGQRRAALLIHSRRRKQEKSAKKNVICSPSAPPPRRKTVFGGHKPGKRWKLNCVCFIKNLLKRGFFHAMYKERHVDKAVNVGNLITYSCSLPPAPPSTLQR